MNLCSDCTLDKGGVLPTYPITISEGICPECDRETSLIPHTDCDWPATGEKAVWD